MPGENEILPQGRQNMSLNGQSQLIQVAGGGGAQHAPKHGAEGTGAGVAKVLCDACKRLAPIKPIKCQGQPHA